MHYDKYTQGYNYASKYLLSSQSINIKFIKCVISDRTYDAVAMKSVKFVTNFSVLVRTSGWKRADLQ